MSQAVRRIQHILDPLLNWSVERKMVVILFFGMVAFPLTSLLTLESKGPEVTSSLLVAMLCGSIILLIPIAKWMSHVVALRNIKELNTQCQLLKQGDYNHVELPSGEMEGHDFTTLKRNMHWMGYTIASRESRLQSAMADLASAQRQITESLDYASLIQRSFLPDRKGLAEALPKHFLLWQQRDAVGGDSYWFKPHGNGFFVGVVDCTGHGVPGAFMTLIVHSLLEKAVADCSKSPAQLLGRMNRHIKDSLKQHQQGAMSDDGMDCCLCYVDLKEDVLLFAGANTPLYVYDGEDVQVVKGDRCGLGYVRSPHDFVFTDVTIDLTVGKRFYMITDGVVDQVGGKGFPFGKRRFKEFVETARSLPMDQQGKALTRRLTAYQGDEIRRDDLTALGFEI